MSTTDVSTFFENHPERRHYVRLLGVRLEDGCVGVLVVTKEPEAREMARIVNWRPGVGSYRFGLKRIEQWLGTARKADAWVDRLIAGKTLRPGRGLTARSSDLTDIVCWLSPVYEMEHRNADGKIQIRPCI